MALPKLNREFQYETKIPSTGAKVSYRPYLVKEEKALLMAAETESQKEILRAMRNIINACFESVEADDLPLFDLEFLFLQLRAKSAGEVTEVGYTCEECNYVNKVPLNLEKAEVNFSEATEDPKIQISDDIFIEMRYPMLKDAEEDADKNKSKVEMMYDLIDKMISKVYTDEDVIDFHDEPVESRQEFIESLNQSQFNKIKNFVEDAPKLQLEVEFKCTNCEHENSITVVGIQNFFG